MSSLASVAEHISDDFILIEDDILIEENAIEQLLNHEERDCVLLTRKADQATKHLLKYAIITFITSQKTFIS